VVSYFKSYLSSLVITNLQFYFCLCSCVYTVWVYKLEYCSYSRKATKSRE